MPGASRRQSELSTDSNASSDPRSPSINLTTANSSSTNPSTITTTHHRRGPWSIPEDQRLMMHVEQNGPYNWVRISTLLGTRSPKQCRERYHQNLKPSLNHEPISEEEGRYIEYLVSEMGTRWAEISRRLPGRSDNAVKNWWNGGFNRRRRAVRNAALLRYSQSTSVSTLPAQTFQPSASTLYPINRGVGSTSVNVHSPLNHSITNSTSNLTCPSKSSLGSSIAPASSTCPPVNPVPSSTSQKSIPDPPRPLEISPSRAEPHNPFARSNTTINVATSPRGGPPSSIISESSSSIRSPFTLPTSPLDPRSASSSFRGRSPSRSNSPERRPCTENTKDSSINLALLSSAATSLSGSSTSSRSSSSSLSSYDSLVITPTDDVNSSKFPSLSNLLSPSYLKSYSNQFASSSPPIVNSTASSTRQSSSCSRNSTNFSKDESRCGNNSGLPSSSKPPKPSSSLPSVHALLPRDTSRSASTYPPVSDGFPLGSCTALPRPAYPVHCASPALTSSNATTSTSSLYQMLSETTKSPTLGTKSKLNPATVSNSNSPYSRATSANHTSMARDAKLDLRTILHV